uniref:BPTI/Kunitz inhibitor domain-containing protein n=1 Tax=Oncorhynchus kisutch TaxID=8019 RepID=A0A8C7KYS2_ONCKI
EDNIPNSTYLTPDPCLLPMSEGGCWEHVLLWYYHPHSGECRPFVYGGCEGNHNRFNTKQECQRWCGKERRGTLPRKPASRSRLFTADVETGVLRVLFSYGCRGSIE